MRARGAVAVVLAIAASAAADFTPSPFVPGLRIVERRTVYRPGSVVRASVLWEFGDSGGASGKFAVRWQLRAANGTILDHGRRRLRIPFSADPPYRFPVRARVPRQTEPWQIATLEVGVESGLGGDILHAARTNVWIQPNRIVPLRDLLPVSVEGRLERSGFFGALAVVPEGDDNRPWTLVGPAAAAALRHPDGEGALVRVCGREVGQTGLVFIPEYAPRFLRADDLEFLDPPPERLLPTGGTGGDYEPPPLPGAYDDDESYRAYLKETQKPGIAESEDDMAALRAEFGQRIDALPAVDFAESRVVVVTAGHCPNPLFVVSFGDAWYDERTGRTVVTYDAIELQLRGPTQGVTTRPWVAAVLPRRPGPVEFRRREWVGELPSWWPPTPPY